MWTILLIISIAAAIAVIEAPPLYKKKAKKELGVFTALLLLGAGLAITRQAAHATLPNPLDWMAAVFGPLGEWMANTLGKGA